MSLEQAINRLADAIEQMNGGALVTKDAPETVPPPATPPPTPATLPPATPDTPAAPVEKTASPLDALDGIPTFISNEQKRGWLVDRLTEMNINIQPRTKTLTLEKKYVELVQSGAAPAAAPPVVEEEDMFGTGEGPAVTKADVSTALSQYVARAKDEKDKATRIEKAKSILAGCGADKVIELSPEHYQTVIDGVRG